jgi:2,3-bisphosphoglycerate-dependent phosphoglycerate mutase
MEKEVKEIILVRHGESVYNKLGKFTGWTDCDLTLDGMKQAVAAGRILKEKGYNFDVAYSSVLKRATHTLDLILEEMQLGQVKINRCWMLNERCYGALEALGRTDAVVKYGEETIKKCRQDYYFRPPSIRQNNRDLGSEELSPVSESMYDAATRVLSCWQKRIIPDVAGGKRVLVVAHGDILRLLTGHLKGLAAGEIAEMPPFPNAVPIVYTLDDTCGLVNHVLLTGTEEIPAVATRL